MPSWTQGTYVVLLPVWMREFGFLASKLVTFASRNTDATRIGSSSKDALSSFNSGKPNAICVLSFFYVNANTSKSEIIGIESIQSVCLEIMTPKAPSGENRKVVVVGHDVAQDIDLILTVDIDVYELPGLVEIIDNQVSIATREDSSYCLSSMLIVLLKAHHTTQQAVPPPARPE